MGIICKQPGIRASVNPSFTFLFGAVTRWQQATFGDRPPTAPLHHLAKEVKEALAAPHDVSEYADMMLLLIDAAKCAGFTARDLLDATYAKLEVNRQRKWQAPDADGVCLHVKDEPE